MRRSAKRSKCPSPVPQCPPRPFARQGRDVPTGRVWDPPVPSPAGSPQPPRWPEPSPGSGSARAGGQTPSPPVTPLCIPRSEGQSWSKATAPSSSPPRDPNGGAGPAWYPPALSGVSWAGEGRREALCGVSLPRAGFPGLQDLNLLRLSEPEIPCHCKSKEKCQSRG